MNIWLEISNSPHINMFSGMLGDLARAHEFIVTTRPLANTVQLLKLHGIKHTVVGKHYGAGRLAKACGYPVRVVLFFFQAEDGIRDLTVTGVQTCALPI